MPHHLAVMMGGHAMTHRCAPHASARAGPHGQSRGANQRQHQRDGKNTPHDKGFYLIESKTANQSKLSQYRLRLSKSANRATGQRVIGSAKTRGTTDTTDFIEFREQVEVTFKP
jgi:hypothetical protein